MTDFIKKSINGRTVYLTEDHHHVLLPWAMERERLACAPHVLTLDHHTDTLPEYTHYDETHVVPHRKIYDRTLPAELESALTDLRHDEHFDFALNNGIIHSAAIFSHVNFSRDVNPAVRIVHDPPPDESIKTLSAYYACALETSFLDANLARAPLPPDRPYILDIDLDYFKGEGSVHPRDPACFLSLIRDAAAITISRERDWVRLLNMDYGNRLFEYFEQCILTMIEKA